MFYQKKGFPEEGEVVICTVTKVYPNSVFVSIDEFNLSGMINIAEVSAGRIRNLREFVTEGKVIFCKVLRVHRDTHHIDLSLRRVSESMRRGKSDELKREQTAEKIIEFVAKKMNVDTKVLYDKIAAKVFVNYKYIHEFFEKVVKEDAKIEELNLDKKMNDEFVETIAQRLKPQRIKISGTFSIVSYAPDGVLAIKDAFVESMKNEDISVKYLGAGKYLIEVGDIDYKNAEKILKKEVDRVSDFIKSKDGVISFERIEQS